ncbi:MAG: glycosyltransferase [Bdellovibrionota bacterium]
MCPKPHLALLFSLGFAVLAIAHPTCRERLTEQAWKYHETSQRKTLIGKELYRPEALQRVAEKALSLKGSGEGPILSIVIPAYRESARIAPSIEALKDFLADYPIDAEIIIVTQHPPGEAPDRTFDIALRRVSDDSRFQVIKLEEKGKGLGVRKGMEQAKGDYVLFMDADLSTPLVEILSFLSYFVDHPQTDVLIGSRTYAPDYFERSPLRNLISFGNQQLRKLLINLDQFDDTQCGFKAFSKNAAQEIFSRQKNNGFLFDLEVLLLAQEMNFKMNSLEVQWFDEPEFSTVDARKEISGMLRDLTQVKALVERTLEEQPYQPNQP